MGSNTTLVTAKKTFWGFKPADLLGIIIMIIPFYISFRPFPVTVESYKKIFLFIGKHVTENQNVKITPNMVSMLCSVAFYCALIARLGLFKTGTLSEGAISAVRTFLNCWVIAALFVMIVPTDKVRGMTWSAFLQNNESLFLLLGVILAWIGMRTISGYCWILFILAAWRHLIELNQAMATWGAVFVITLVVSLLLQISSYANLSDILQEFGGSTAKYAVAVGDNMSAAAADVTQKVDAASTYVRKKVMPASQNQTQVGPKPVYYVGKNAEQNVPSRSMPAGNAEDILKALDANGDGVVDEKDIELLRKK